MPPPPHGRFGKIHQVHHRFGGTPLDLPPRESDMPERFDDAMITIMISTSSYLFLGELCSMHHKDEQAF
jgi:hypothetical protein